MTDREKLVKLIAEAKSQWEGGTNNLDGRIADHLIANGVTINQWIPVTERLPEGGSFVLCCSTRGFHLSTALHEKRRDKRKFAIEEGDYCITVTHWMPLPEPPKEE